MPAEIDWDAPEPLFRQLADVLRARIKDGTYERRIPPMSALRAEFELAKNTVSAAVKVLADEGLVRGVPGRGVFVIKADEAPEP